MVIYPGLICVGDISDGVGAHVAGWQVKYFSRCCKQSLMMLSRSVAISSGAQMTMLSSPSWYPHCMAGMLSGQSGYHVGANFTVGWQMCGGSFCRWHSLSVSRVRHRCSSLVKALHILTVNRGALLEWRTRGSWCLPFTVCCSSREKLKLIPCSSQLRTHLGKPIHPRPEESPEELAARVHKAVSDLIQKHQRLPGNILRALLARLYESPKID